MGKYGPEVARLLDEVTGEEIKPGDRLKEEIRGHAAVFLYVSRLPGFGKSGKIFTDVRPGGEFFPSVAGARIEVAERFRSYTEESVDGVLHIETLSDTEVLQLGRDKEWSSPVFRKVNAFMSRGGRLVNPSWIQAEGATVAYGRGLITGEELDALTD